MSVGQELLDVPLPDMVAKLGMGVAKAQSALDQNSINTLQMLNDDDNKIEIVTGITKVIAEDGTVTFEDPQTAEMTPFQVGLFPAFYQFSEATIEVKMDIKTTTSSETDVKVSAEAKVGFSMWSASISTDVSHNRKFGKDVNGTSRLMTKMVPVPPPERLEPEYDTIDNRQPQEEDSE